MLLLAESALPNTTVCSHRVWRTFRKIKSQKEGRHLGEASGVWMKRGATWLECSGHGIHCSALHGTAKIVSASLLPPDSFLVVHCLVKQWISSPLAYKLRMAYSELASLVVNPKPFLKSLNFFIFKEIMILKVCLHYDLCILRCLFLDYGGCSGKFWNVLDVLEGSGVCLSLCVFIWASLKPLLFNHFYPQDP